MAAKRASEDYGAAMDLEWQGGLEDLEGQISRADLVALDIDARMAALWADLGEVGLDRRHLAIVAIYMRAAYGKGYCDALREPRGQLLKDHGYLLPRPQAPEPLG